MKYRKIWEKTAVFCLLLALLLPMAAHAESAEDRIRALEARVAELEAQIEALLGGTAEVSSPEANTIAVGEPVTLAKDLTLTICGYRTDTHFEYYPAGGFIATSLISKAGYQMLLLSITLDNGTDQELRSQGLLEAALTAGGDFTAQARDPLFQLTTENTYSGGLKRIGASTQVQGCLLFPIPEASVTDGESLVITFAYDGQTYACWLKK